MASTPGRKIALVAILVVVVVVVAAAVSFGLGRTSSAEKKTGTTASNPVTPSEYAALAKGMSQAAVRKAIGQPTNVVLNPATAKGGQCWYYAAAHGGNRIDRFCFRGGRLVSKSTSGG